MKILKQYLEKVCPKIKGLKKSYTPIKRHSAITKQLCKHAELTFHAENINVTIPLNNLWLCSLPSEFKYSIYME